MNQSRRSALSRRSVPRRTVLGGALAAVPVALVAAGPAHADEAASPATGVPLASNGRPVVRDIQIQLAARYGARTGFPAVTTDGVWTGDSHSALIHALQLEMGIDEATANGVFGPLTRTTLQQQTTLAVGSADTTGYLVHLLQASLVVMSTWDGPVDGAFSTEQGVRLAQFQRTVALPETGRADHRTWAALLASNGDPTRPGTAADGITVITAERAKTLRDAGCTTVARYLTDSDRPDALAKRIQDGELDAILAGGLTVVPIFQEGGTDTTYFSYDLGVRAAGRADDAARRLGFLPGTTVYYAVDFDATRDEVETYLEPHFRGIHAELRRRGSAYRVGVYAGRRICATLAAAHLTELSYVADMSTGWGANLGVRIPEDWAFDQILERTIGQGDQAFDIDTVVASGRDAGQSRVEPRG
ncbi:peptidoglycan hydrolase-like protein with peptidoglycan-binding domain [Clavibacter michiganensis]|uniref:glycoside hydrolase domain-containing protein n=1 Tax=Clavibacter michiganensis TaxID=28447 RepID=UPI001AE2053A|nr:glycoside hydrolase domain-containing protein [Clavibacter michiganensis]MBP2457025.1 peptidoglycan hydrolase-like protein with peptidoglycan-binding domain [Clavibacter michiganensis]MDQ0409595.1 peptidoglycan hydrolase-like protein with peptidoglycan-binding domain [Clavibacter michiganensis]